MDPRDAETAKWLGEVIDAGDSPASSTNFLPAASITHSQVTATSAATIASEAKPIRTTTQSQSAAARVAAIGATRKESTGTPVREYRTSSPLLTTTTLPTSASRSSIQNGQGDAAQRASRLAAGAANDALYHPRQTSESPRVSRFSSAGAAASLAAESHQSNMKISQSRMNDLALERSAAGRAAILAARDSAPYEIPDHALSANAGKAALLAHKDHVEYEVPVHALSANAGKAALLAAHDHVEYEVPQHELSANAGKAALLAAHDHVEYEVPPHELSANAGKAALLAHADHREYEVPVHQMSASASNAALQAHADHKEYEVPVHQLSANAGKAALLAHHDHKEYQVPDHALSANAGKAALLAHRDTISVPSKPNPVSAASAANALKAATQAHHDPAMRPTKPEDLQAKGAANALKAASQAHQEAPAPFKYVHPADDPQVGQLARRNTQAYLSEMDPRAPHDNTVKYANMSYNSAKAREGRASDYRAISDEAYRSAGLAGMSATPSEYSFTPATRPRTSTTSTVNKAPVDLMALARRNVDAQMAERGLSRTASQQTVSTIGAANSGANLAFRDGRERQIESDRQRAAYEDADINARINREMAQFDQQRKKNQNSGVVQSALMEAAKRNARLSMAQMEANRPYSAPNLRDTQRLEDLLNDQKLAARREASNGAMVDIGGGHYMSQVEIEAVAARRVQPVFDEMDQHVAEINRRKAEVEAQRKAEQERREAESAERRRLRDIEKERERNTKEAEKKAKAEAKAKRAAEKAELEQQRREEAEARRQAERERREEAHAAERRRVEEARLAREEEEQKAAELKRSGSAEAVATAGVVHSDAQPAANTEDTTLPGTNAPLAGQSLESNETETTETHHAGTSATAEAAATTADPTLRRTETVDSLNEPVATYQVEHRGMTTDTEGETDDEWADAMEETPAIERAEYISIGTRSQLTNENLASQGPIREESGEDIETASISTARPTKAEVEPVHEAPAAAAATTSAAAATTTSTSDAKHYSGDLPALGRVIDYDAEDATTGATETVPVVPAPVTVPSHAHEQTRFKEELS